MSDSSELLENLRAKALEITKGENILGKVLSLSLSNVKHPDFEFQINSSGYYTSCKYIVKHKGRIVFEASESTVSYGPDINTISVSCLHDPSQWIVPFNEIYNNHIESNRQEAISKFSGLD